MDNLGFDRIFPRAFLPDRTKSPWGIEEIYEYSMFFDQIIAESLGDEIATKLREAIIAVQNNEYFARKKECKYPFRWSCIIT